MLFISGHWTAVELGAEGLNAQTCSHLSSLFKESSPSHLARCTTSLFLQGWDFSNILYIWRFKYSKTRILRFKERLINFQLVGCVFIASIYSACEVQVYSNSNLNILSKHFSSITMFLLNQISMKMELWKNS